ncbi:type II toxin-antitoxin system RelE/ParE family toxin [Rhizobium sp. NTR19]|uniref:Type II toxin-antitoxin system RelE/ParE family toxin n=1 Tax=Neorhizobium turbinariae TaxID=2937795 RepID=A0ABT0IRI6_9HYPH|nr:type II toxin-antitoxin system RelE/ParE family toxin [Neorhizobium turbinariae]MCK8780494.1 type II toxin-antitoxin system RelE/ParE family toxin [Neorhizobium turbinariae]
MRIVFTRRYLQELSTIGDYTTSHDARAAARVVNAIHSRTTRALSANPFMGRSGKIKGAREFVVTGTPYIVAYRVTEEQVEVLFVQHGAREWPDEAQRSLVLERAQSM